MAKRFSDLNDIRSVADLADEKLRYLKRYRSSSYIVEYCQGMVWYGDYSLINSRHEVRRVIDAGGGKGGSVTVIPPPASPETMISFPLFVTTRVGAEANSLASSLPITPLFSRGSPFPAA